jgi:hypothetical protein
MKNYPPQGGIGFARLTIDDTKLNDVRVVLPTGYDAIKICKGASILEARIERND